MSLEKVGPIWLLKDLKLHIVLNQLQAIFNEPPCSQDLVIDEFWEEQPKFNVRQLLSEGKI